MHQNDGNEVKIGQDAIVTVTDMGHLVEVLHMKRRNTECHIKKIDADRYILIETGEIFEFQKAENRGESADSLRKTFKRLRYLVNGNFRGEKNELFITLTYAENMTDRERLYKDFKNFMQRFRNKLKLKSSELDYISVVEPQERGAWHMHVLLKFNGQKSAFVPSKLLQDAWGHGFVKLQRIEGVDNIGAYLTAYLSDVEIPENLESMAEFEGLIGKTVVIRKVDGKDKKFIKGGRLWRYPSGMNLYRCSRGIVMPERVEMSFKDIKKIVGAATPHYQKSYEIERDSFKNTITYQQYNLKRQ